MPGQHPGQGVNEEMLLLSRKQEEMGQQGMVYICKPNSGKPGLNECVLNVVPDKPV
ncbi:hypothetical protein DPMN_176301 [Dreissena polymorpha]|uniref:Uncharacterized protein n=1 Tax=Dreissena polymorpha TaxID=45954 RepID=A0A9D4IJI1_DREPO|nr:hypothetical protein DPMN_176301 [Dreissena polymorpha]